MSNAKEVSLTTELAIKSQPQPQPKSKKKMEKKKSVPAIKKTEKVKKKHEERKGVVRKYRGTEGDSELAQAATRKSLNQTALYDTSSYTSIKSKTRFRCFARYGGMYTPDNLHDNVLRLHKYCLTHLLDSYRVHLNRLKGIAVLEELIHKVYFDDLKISQVVRIIWSSISIVHHFHIRLKVGSGFTVWNRRRQAQRANNSFDHLMDFLLPELFVTIIHSIVTFFEEARLWDTELLCSDLIQRVLRVCNEHIKCLNILLDVVETSTPSNGRKVIRVIYDLIRDYKWGVMDEDLMYRLLAIYRDSILTNDICDYSYLKKGLEVCIRRILKNISSSDLLKIIENMLTWSIQAEITDEALLDFGNVLEYAAILYKPEHYIDCFSENILDNILTLIASPNLLNSLLGHRVLQHMMDRKFNRSQFDTPRIFFKQTHFNINVGPFDASDKRMIKKHREKIHANLLASVQQHGKHRINLESAYTTMALFVVEVPCGFTAASIVCLAMAIQEAAISNDNLDLESSNRIHAVVMSIMSLVCWTHNAEVYYEYLNTILQRRAEFSPHLNPPLQTTYDYARHHILWNKPELFFEDWEVRYGLWKCFRSKRQSTDMASKRDTSKETFTAHSVNAGEADGEGNPEEQKEYVVDKG